MWFSKINRKLLSLSLSLKRERERERIKRIAQQNRNISAITISITIAYDYVAENFFCRTHIINTYMFVLWLELLTYVAFFFESENRNYV